VTKSFAGVTALVKGEIDLHAGQVTALIGENGAGKSTLVKILTGVYTADSGEIRMMGKEVAIGSVERARSLGITAIHQEAVVFDDLSVAENIFIADRPRRRLGPFGPVMIDWASMRRRASAILNDLDTDIDPDTPMRNLGVAQKHMVQIARALSEDARIVIMDEPTAALSQREIDELFVIVRRLKSEGRAILFISHKLEEVFAISDRYAVFRDGAAVGAGDLAQTDRNQLIGLMIGRSVDQIFPKVAVPIGDEVLRVEGFSHPTEFADVSFSLRRSEILGFYGLVGAGRSELMRAIFGLTRPSSGRLWLDGREITIHNPDQAIALGIAYLPEDRQHEGAILGMPIFQNITLPHLSPFARFGFLDRSAERAEANRFAERVQIRMASVDQNVEELSGGNQQKTVVAKWLATKPQILILDEPTKGIDVGSKSVIHRFMGELVKEGLSVIMVSSELPEVLGLSDRIAVMRRGRLRAVIDRSDATPEAIVRAAMEG
jgi:rhamnose transport system ATP-binding protein